MVISSNGLTTRLAAFLAGITCLVGTASAQVTYTYSGAPFTSATPPYTNNDRVTGSFTLPLPLPPNLASREITDLVLDYQFEDGVQVRSSANSALCNLFVSTNSSGALTDWSIFLRESPVPAPGNPQQFMDITQTIVQVGVGDAGSTVCDVLVNLVGASNGGGGSWTNDAGGSASYLYQGQPFTQFDGPYSNGNAVSGTVILSGSLPPSLPPTDLSLFLLGLEYEDGVQTRTLANSEVCDFMLGTDASGVINQWGVFLRESPWPGLGLPQRFLDSGSASDQAGTGEAGATVCDTISVFINSGSSSNPGSWAMAGTLAIPAMSAWSAVTLIVAMLGLALWLTRAGRGEPTQPRTGQ